MGFYDRKLAREGYQVQEPRLPAPALTPHQRNVSQIPSDIPQNTFIAQKAQDELGHCPGCGSPNYVGPTNRYGLGTGGNSVTTEHGLANAMPHCFDCGFNPKMGSYLTALGGVAGEASKATSQTAQGGMITHNFHAQDSGVHMISAT